MQIIHKIETHLDRKEPAPIVDTVMGETARAVEVSFYEKDQPWPIPEDAHVTIRCGNLDWGTVYDCLPDGTAAFSLRDNTATVVLSPELLQQIGVNYVQLVLTQNDAVLITFMFHVRVEPDPSAGKPGCPEGERNPSKCQQAVADSIAAAQRAEEAARRAEEASKNHQQEYLNIAKYNVDGYGPLAIGAYNGSFEQNIIVPAGFVPIPQDMDLNNAMNIMPGVLNGTYQIKPGNEDTVDFEAGFAFPARVCGGHQAIVVIDPARGKLWHFEFPEYGDYTVNTCPIGISKTDTAGIPDYWQAHLTEKVAAIREKRDSIGNHGVAFIAVTDRHEGNNAGHTAVLIRAIEEKTGLIVADLGDCASSGVHPDKADLLTTLDAVLEGYHGLNVLRHRGNHDASYGTANGEPYAFNLSNKESYSRIFSQLPESCVLGGDGQYYYYDDRKTKTRFLCLNTMDHPYEENDDGTAKYNGQNFYSIRQAQVDFIISALNVEEGWHIIVTCHVPPVVAYDEKFPTATYLRKLLAAYNSKTAFSANYNGQFGGEKQYTDLADHNDSGWQSGVRVNSSMAVVSVDDVNQVLTNPMAVGGSNKFHIKGLNVYDATVAGSNYCRVALLNSAMEIVAYAQLSSAVWQEFYTVSDYDEAVAIVDVEGIIAKNTGLDVAYVRSGGYAADPANVIITRDEEITASETGWDALTINADFSGYKGQLVGMVAGHMHQDLAYNEDNCNDLNFPVVTVGRDAILDEVTYGLERTEGTTTEHSFDVIAIDFKERTIHTVKIGAGADREIRY